VEGVQPNGGIQVVGAEQAPETNPTTNKEGQTFAAVSRLDNSQGRDSEQNPPLYY
jgi:hypothetical protein